MSRIIYILLIVLIIAPLGLISPSLTINAPIALLMGLVYAMIFRCPYPTFNKKTSKLLLQAAVVCLGFGMNLYASLRSGADGMLFTVVSVIGVMALGVLGGMALHIDRTTSYLISSGTAICGGSAIAAVGPVVRANSSQMAVSLGVIFILNSLALFVFPPVGHELGMSQTQFGTWAAIAIHDTSSVVGAGEVYGPEALATATLVKLTRALWIIPLALVTMLIFPAPRGESGRRKIAVPWFIFMFIGAMIINTFLPLPEWFTATTDFVARRGMVLTLFLIGASLSPSAIKSVGIRPLLLAVVLWVVISAVSLGVVMTTLD